MAEKEMEEGEKERHKDGIGKREMMNDKDIGAFFILMKRQSSGILLSGEMSCSILL